MKMMVEAPHRILDISGEAESPLGKVVGDEQLETGLEDRDLTTLEPLDLALVDVGANDVAPRLGETGSPDEPDIAVPITETFTWCSLDGTRDTSPRTSALRPRWA